MTATAELEVTITWRTPAVVAAAVRDLGGGIHDVRKAGGWTCSCGAAECPHVFAVRRLVGERS